MSSGRAGEIHAQRRIEQGLAEMVGLVRGVIGRKQACKERGVTGQRPGRRREGHGIEDCARPTLEECGEAFSWFDTGLAREDIVA